ncbi:MAG: YtxH domain-containing protein [Lewinellaceae bacterium]|nr:YtxH domain-containing protein [Lewinellaceae bacterium]
MKPARWLTPLIIALFLSSVLWGQQTNPPAENDKERYEFLKEELKDHRAFLEQEGQKYREFLMEERREHRIFLESYYTILGAGAGIVAALAVGLFSFFGWRTRNDIREQLEEYKRSAQEKFQIEVDKARNAFTQEVQEKFKSNPLLLDAEARYQALIQLVQQAVGLSNGKFLFIGVEEKIKTELEKFTAFLAKPTVKAWNNGLALEDYDVVIYYFDPIIMEEKSDNGQPVTRDLNLEQLVEQLDGLKGSIPLVVYSHGEWVTGTTKDKLSTYSLHHLSNNPISLIDNVASAFRVAQLMGDKIQNFS